MFLSLSLSLSLFLSLSLSFSHTHTHTHTHMQQILVRTDKLLQSGTILETLKHTDHSTIHLLMGKIKQLMTDFDDRLGKRKKKIDESVQLHKLTEMVREGCREQNGRGEAGRQGGREAVEEWGSGEVRVKWVHVLSCSGYVSLCNCPPLLLCSIAQRQLCLYALLIFHYKV